MTRSERAARIADALDVLRRALWCAALMPEAEARQAARNLLPVMRRVTAELEQVAA